MSNNICLNLSQFSRILCDFPWLFQSVQNSLTFPWLENAFPFFQVFQSEWEPWLMLRNENRGSRLNKYDHTKETSSGMYWLTNIYVLIK